jgi:hypothetical protein
VVAATKPRVLPLVTTFGAFAIIASGVAVWTGLFGSVGLAVAEGICAALLGAICVLWLLILFAPGLVKAPTRIDIDPVGVAVLFSNGQSRFVGWSEPPAQFFLLDTRTSVRKARSLDEPVLFLYSQALGTLPLSDEGAQCVRETAHSAGLKVVDPPYSPVSLRGTPLPRRVGMSVPFGTTITLLSAK